MPPKIEGIYRLSPRGMAIVNKHKHGSVMDTLIGMDREIELLKQLIIATSKSTDTIILRKDDPALTG